MATMETIRELLPTLRGLSDRIPEVLAEVLEKINAELEKETNKEKRDELFAELANKYADPYWEQLRLLRATAPKIRGLRHEGMPPNFLDKDIEDLTEFYHLCFSLEETGREQNSAPDASAKDPKTELDKVYIPWCLPALGELLLDKPQHFNDLTTSKPLLDIAGDWVRTAAKLYLTCLHYRDEKTETSQSIANITIQLAEYLCKHATPPSVDVLLALDKIAGEGNLEDPSHLTDKYAGLLLSVLEQTEMSPTTASAFKRLLNLAGRDLLDKQYRKDELPRLVNLLWSKAGVPDLKHWISDMGIEEIPGDPIRYIFGLEEEEPRIRDDALIQSCKLVSAYWLARAYERLEDEGRELFCSHAFHSQSRELPFEFDFDLGLTSQELDTFKGRHALLWERLQGTTPWKITPTTHTEFTRGQVEYFASETAIATVERLRKTGGGLSDLLANDVEPALKEEFSYKCWGKIHSDAKVALKAAQFIRRTQPPSYDFGGAVVLEWKALEICLYECLVKGIPLIHEPLGYLIAGSRRSKLDLSIRLKYIAEAIEGASSETHQKIRTALSDELRKWKTIGSTIRYASYFRNEGAHERPVSLSDSNTSRAFVVRFIKSLLAKNISSKETEISRVVRPS